MKRFVIRLFEVEDYEDVYALWIRTPGMGLNNIDDSKEGIAKFLKRNPSTCFVAEEIDTERIVGAIITGNDGRRGYIYHACCDINVRRFGIGTNLVDAALNALKKEGISKVALVVFEKNKSGNDFWEHLGFTLRADLNYRNKALTAIDRIDT